MKAKTIEQLKEEAKVENCHKVNLIRNVESDLKQRINNKVCFSSQPIFYKDEINNEDVSSSRQEYKDVIEAFTDAGWSAGIYAFYESEKLGMYLFVNRPDAIGLSAKEILEERHGR